VTLTKNGTSLSTGTFTNSTSTLSFNDSIPASGSVTYLVAVNFSSTAPLGTYMVSITGGGGTNGNEVNFSGLPLLEAVVTIVTATFTPTVTSTYTVTDSPTSTNTITVTSTCTMTGSPTNTHTFTPIPIKTNTQTVTASPTPLEARFLPPYPNPSRGTPILFEIQSPNQCVVTMDVFTLSFRKILSQTIQVDGSQTIQWDLNDSAGKPAANGIYYVRLQATGTQANTKVIKVMILR
jgi:hypothetical protein